MYEDKSIRNISKNIIIDLENDNIKNNPDIIFNIGHLRSYSNFLELDTDTIIEKFKNRNSLQKMNEFCKQMSFISRSKNQFWY